MFKLILKLFKKDKGEDKIDLFLKQLEENNIYFPGNGNHLMEQFIREGIEKGFIKIEEE
ncbi:TPA: hypothetical protein LA742_001239 [Clostridium botulinum]|uniref:hypothetical protein n=1 Tax=Clostridium TaxID=1485 RepID=UPI00094764F9|nr:MULTISPECIES: hypothetical protein [Clostridium]APQ78715.1 hypothetical protein RSJ10_3787 [Clostridium botulinum]HBJ2612806.1 hypothetical protein [Clostridium botulinum]